jgi:putative hydrolase of the HAD superfamily
MSGGTRRVLLSAGAAPFFPRLGGDGPVIALVRQDSAVTRAVLWDFDGTLAVREGMWSGCLLEALDALRPGHGVSRDAVRAGLRDGFPWHTPDIGHAHTADSWWAALAPVFVRTYGAAGVAPDDALAAAAEVRRRYTDPAGWTVFPDVVPVLERLAAYRHVIVSNHVPELPALVAALGLAPYVTAVVTSAAVGWEKPHPRIYAAARAAAGDPDEVWMVGDNVVADVRGAEAVGIPAILVRTADPSVTRSAASLAGVVTYLTA